MSPLALFGADLTPVEVAQLGVLGAGFALLVVWLANRARGENLLPEGPSPAVGFGILDAVVVVVLWLAAEFGAGLLAAQLGWITEEHGVSGNGYLLVKAGHLLVVAYALFVLSRPKEHGPRGRSAAAGALSAVASLPVVFAVLYVTQLLVESAGGKWAEQDVLDQLRRTVPWKFVAIAVVLAPVTEEVLFRGTIYLAVKRASGGVPAALVSALLFAAVHPPYYQFAPAMFLLGLALAYVYERTGTLFTPVAFHATFNLFTVLGAILGSGG